MAQTGRQVKLVGLWYGSVRVWRKCGGASRSEGGLGPNLRSPPNLSPLPVSVHTHSLNLHTKIKFSPIILFFLFIIVSLTPFIVFVWQTYLVPNLLPTPTFPSWRGIRERLASCLEAQ